MSAPPITYAERPPGAALADVVQAFWHVRVDAALAAPVPHRVWPDVCAGLTCDPGAGEAWLVGPRETPRDLLLPPGARYWGARLLPGSARCLVAAPVAALVGRSEPAAHHLAGVNALLAALAAAGDDAARGWGAFEAWVAARRRAVPPDAAVRAAVARLESDEGASTADLAREAGLGARQLQRRFAAGTGLTVRRYRQLRRLRLALLRLAHAPPASAATRPALGAVAADAGYADQAHFAREAARFAALTPRALRRRVTGIAHEWPAARPPRAGG